MRVSGFLLVRVEGFRFSIQVLGAYIRGRLGSHDGVRGLAGDVANHDGGGHERHVPVDVHAEVAAHTKPRTTSAPQFAKTR